MRSGHLPPPRQGTTWRGLALSDLHLFREGSRGEEAAAQLRAAAADADFLVLNGDIFDFRWSSHATLEMAEEAAQAWLLDFAAAVTPARVLYILGNHDGHWRFRDRLGRELCDVANLEWFAAFVRVGSALFLHGDIPLFGSSLSPLERLWGRSPHQRGRLLRFWNTRIVYPFFGRLAPLVFPTGASARLVARAVTRHGPDRFGKLRDICFGHIHHPFQEVPVGPFHLHNSGAPLPGFRWQLIEIPTTTGDWEGR